MVDKTSFKQHAYAMVTRNVGRRHQRGIFRSAHIVQVIGLCQNKKPFRLWGLDFRKLLAEVLDKDIVERSGDAHRFFSEHFECLVQFFEVLLGHKGPCR
jgi:hypothetical protein